MPEPAVGLLWDEWNEEHIARHHVTPTEVEDVTFGAPWVLRARGRDTWAHYGQTDAGRYLLVILAQRGAGWYYPVTARDMTDAERRRYRQQQRR